VDQLTGNVLECVGPTGVLKVLKAEYGKLQVVFTTCGDVGGQHTGVGPTVHLANGGNALVI